MKRTITTTSPADVWKFFKELSPERAAFLQLGPTGLRLTETDDMSEPPEHIACDNVTRSDWQAFLRVLVALRGGRPVKVSPGETPDSLRIFCGPKT